MTKAKKADLLLCAAKHWQNGTSSGCQDCDEFGDDYYDPHEIFETDPDGWRARQVDSASAALSEVAALGFDLESVEP